MSSRKLRNRVKKLLGPQLSATIYESPVVKLLNHPNFVIADLRLDGFRKRTEIGNDSIPSAKGYSNIMWQFWDAGWGSAPRLSRFCSEVSEATLSDFSFQRLSSREIQEMELVGQATLKLYLEKRISPAGFADVVRFRLIEKFGGFWLDTTALAIAEWELSSCELLSYGRTDSAPGKFWFNNWFIGGNELGPYLGKCADLLECYWVSMGGQKHYFDAFFAMKRIAMNLGSPRPDGQYSIQILPSTTLIRHLRWGSTKDELIRQIRSSPLHKLSYKSVDENYVIDALRSILREV